MPVCFVRHGDTEWSFSGQHTGRTDLALTAQGRKEALELRPCLHSVEFSHVLTSSRLRARQTCELAGLGARAEIEPALSEWDYGDYEGRRSFDICRDRPNWNVFRDGCPNGETPVQVSDRADGLIAHLHALDGNVVLFSHGQFGGALAARWLGLPVQAGQHFSLAAASLSVLAHNPSHPDVPVIELWNATPANLLRLLVNQKGA